MFSLISKNDVWKLVFKFSLNYIFICFLPANSWKDKTAKELLHSLVADFKATIVMLHQSRGDCKRPCFDQLHAHILERQQDSKRYKMCAFSWSKHGRSQSPLDISTILSVTISISIYEILKFECQLYSHIVDWMKRYYDKMCVRPTRKPCYDKQIIESMKNVIEFKNKKIITEKTLKK